MLALAAACMLLALCQEDAHPAYMASTAAAVLADQLLQVCGAGEGRSMQHGDRRAGGNPPWKHAPAISNQFRGVLLETESTALP